MCRCRYTSKLTVACIDAAATGAFPSSATKDFGADTSLRSKPELSAVGELMQRLCIVPTGRTSGGNAVSPVSMCRVDLSRCALCATNCLRLHGACATGVGRIENAATVDV